MIGRRNQRVAEVPAGRTEFPLEQRFWKLWPVFVCTFFKGLLKKKKKEEEDVTETIGHLQSKLLTSELCFLWSVSRKSVLSPNVEHQGCLSKEKTINLAVQV